MNKLIQAVIEQDIAFLKKNLTSKNINIIYDFSVINTINVHLNDGTERSEFEYDDEKGTLLHLAAWYNLPNSAKILIKKGADVNAKDIEGRTPLEVAANRYDVVTYPVQRVLIENNADMNFYVTKFLRNVPLLYNYLWDEQFEMAKLAIENGADVNMKIKDGDDSILGLAERRGTPEIVEMLKAKGAKYSNEYLIREREEEREPERLYQILIKKAEEAVAERKNRENLEKVLEEIIIKPANEDEDENNLQMQEIKKDR